jgi:serine/threonine protein kinase
MQVASGLSHIHDKSVIHRDIKPQNILISADNTFLIADFGVAVETGAHVSGRVRTGKGGTLQCMAPEICEDRPYSGKVRTTNL